MWEPYKSRREEHGVQLYGALGVARDDAEGRLAQYKRNFEFFNAPVALFIAIDRKLGPGQWADLGGYIHALTFLARGYGLDTCPQESWARMHRIVGASSKCRRSRCCSARSPSATATTSTRPTVFARRAPRSRSFARFLGLSEVF